MNQPLEAAAPEVRLLSAAQLRCSAYHEAGHVVMAATEDPPRIAYLAQIRPVVRPSQASGITNVPPPVVGDRYLRMVQVATTDEEVAACVREIRYLVAGEESALRIDVRYNGAVHAHGDRDEALRFARVACKGQYDRGVDLVAQTRAAVRDELGQPSVWRQVVNVAECLLAEHDLDQDAIAALLDRRPIRQPFAG